MRGKQWAGLVLLIVVVVGAMGYSYVRNGTLDPVGLGQGARYKPLELKGYVGGEKIGFLQDEAVQEILENRYNITLDFVKAGSIEMVKDVPADADFLWPSSQVAMEIYKLEGGEMAKEEVIFNSPIVLYSWDVVADALEAEGIVERIDESYYVVDLPALVRLVQEGTSWADLGVPQLYGNVAIVSTDPTKSNSGFQFSGLLASTFNGGAVVDDVSIEQHLDAVDAFYTRLGFLHSSSGDLFSQYLKQGIGAYPLVVGYENQVVEFGLEHQESLDQIKDKLRILYPQPTVWSSHTLIMLNHDGTRLVEALLDPEIQQLAWTRHGFRTGLPGIVDDPSVLSMAGIPATIDMVIPMPKPTVMDRIIQTLEQ